MQVKQVPEGYDKVLQFNVYMKDDEGRSPADLKFTIRGDNDHYRIDEYTRSGRQYVPDLQEEDYPVRGEYYRQPRQQPEPRLSPDEVSDVRQLLRTVRHSPSDQEGSRKPEPRTPGTADRTQGPNTAEKPELATAEKTPDPNQRTKLAGGETEEQKRSKPSTEDGNYLDIFVRTKDGDEKLVYHQGGEIPDVVHRYSPKRTTTEFVPERYPELDFEPTMRKSREILNDYYYNYRRPDPYVATRPLHYAPIYSDDEDVERYVLDEYRPRRDPLRGDDVEIYLYPKNAKPPEEIVVVSPRDRYAEEIELERRLLNSRQRQLIETLEDEKEQLKGLVGKLCNKLDAAEERRYEPFVSRYPPHETYVEVPRKVLSKSPCPRLYRRVWDTGRTPKSRSPGKRDPMDLLSSPPKRRMPFDVDARLGKTEWDLADPKMKRMDRMVNSGKMRNANTPRAGDKFCGYCDYYGPNVNLVQKPVSRGFYCCKNSPADNYCPVAAPHPQTYYVEGKIVGQADY